MLTGLTILVIAVYGALGLMLYAMRCPTALAIFIMLLAVACYFGGLVLGSSSA